VAIACNCRLLPSGTWTEPGRTLRETAAAGVTFTTAAPVILPEEALIVVVPVPLATALPVALTLATPVPEELQVAELVMSVLDPSLYKAVAASCSASPIGNDDWPGLTVIDTRAADATVTDVLPDIP
jgi:hypothetical protein